jgi:hypothetical protein
MDRPTPSSTGPAVFFRGQYAFRSLNGAMAVLVLLLAGSIFAVLATTIATHDDDKLLSTIVRVGFAGFALVFGGSGLRALWGWVRNHRVVVEINADGILRGQKFWPWDQVRTFAGTSYDNGVSLEFTPRRMMWGTGALPTTPHLTVDQYVALARELDEFLSVEFPNVKVLLLPQAPTGG